MRILLIAAMMTLGACSGGKDLAQSEQAIARFHEQLNSGQFDEIYRNASSEWKGASSQADSQKLFAAVRKKLGSFQSGKQVGWRANYGTGGSTVVVQYASKYEKGAATETFTYRPSDPAPVLIGYNINSPVLITG